ncbi:restriction endonuclease subunit S, partial [Siminovitchia sp. 179-K 8D1 HS]|uniref:restriction endonuclease subunit S n=1 Tax=Siminovitchia sp. 179-K 8D1 HS TaxID=3142385 RepID=UPI0039A346BC
VFQINLNKAYIKSPSKNRWGLFDAYKTTLLDKGILSIKQQVTRLEEYRTRLISDVVTGKVDVRDIEIPEYEADSDETIDDEIDDNLVLDEEDGEMEVE